MTHSDWSNVVTHTGCVPGARLSLVAEPPREASGEASRDFQIDLYTHPSRGSAAKTIGSFNIDDGNCSENVSFKMNSRFFKRCHVYSNWLKIAHVGEFSWSRFLEDHTQHV